MARGLLYGEDMTRFDIKHAHQVAREFAASHEARIFHDLGSSLRGALIDAWIMRRIRESHVADSTIQLTATDIVEFRDAVAAELAAGVVRANTRGMKCAFKVEE
jgi:hypothetical protein